MYYFENIIEELEKNMTQDIDVKALAQEANMSVYEFRRIFTFITKIPFGEYVRKRRLSLAALELYEGRKKVTDLFVKYGYDSPSSFSRAFKDFHGISPSECMSGNGNFRLLTRLNTEIITTGGMDITYSIYKRQGFTVSGFYDISNMTDSECCEDVWNHFYNSEYAGKICSEADKIYAVYDNGKDFVKCYIGIVEGDYTDSIFIPETEWACFRLVGTDDDYVNKFYNNVLNQWFSSSGYIKNNKIPNIEVFPSDMSEENFEWEIWIPVKKGILDK